MDGFANSYTEIMTANSILAVHHAVVSGLCVSVLGTSCLGHSTRDVRSALDLPNLPWLMLGLYDADTRKSALVDTFGEVLELPSN